MRIFFIGCVAFSIKTLKKIVALKGNIVGVATKSKSNFNADHFDLAPMCNAYNIPCKYVKDINASHIIDWIKDLKPDVIFVFGWSSLIKEELLTLPPIGVIGFHPTDLPMNRGRHPIIWTLVLGLNQTASTFFFIDKGMDSGDILSQHKILISDSDDAASLYEKITNTAINQIVEFLPLLQKNTFNRIKQEDENINYWRKRGQLDGQIDFRMTSKGIYNLVRALTRPYVGAHILYKEKEVKIWKVKERKYEKSNLEPGKILHISPFSILVKTYDGAIEILEHEFTVLPKINYYL